MQRVVVSVRPKREAAAPGQPAGWVVSFANRQPGQADLAVGDPVEMPAVRLVLELGGGQQRSVIVPHAGEMGVEALTALLTRRALGRVEDGDGPAYGRWLHGAMFRTRWPEIEGLSDQSGLELALAWDADDHHLNSLVWESMYDARGEPLAALARPRALVAFTRLTTPSAPRTAEQLGLPIRTVPRVLFAMGASLDDPLVRPGAMFLGLLRSFEAEGTCVARVIPNVDLAELAKYCDRYRPEIVHLVAHGQVHQSGEVTLNLGGEHVTHAQIRQAIGHPLALFLSACETGRAGADQAPLAAQLVRDGIPIVVGMAGKIGVGACRMFTRKLIESVSAGEGLVAGSAEGRRAAMLTASDSGNDLDWALPTVFMSDQLDPDCRILDTEATQRANTVVGNLRIGRGPAFCGRRKILDVADGLLPRPGEELDERAARGLFVIHASGPSFDKLGSRRLLREIACRYVRAGHVPLLVGPFTQGMAPTTFAALVGELLTKIVAARKAVGLPPRWPELFGEQPAKVGYGAIEAKIKAFAGSAPNAEDVKEGLAPEFASLAEGHAAQGAPFGSHTHVAVLGDAVHEWNDAIETLVGVLTRAGLGTPSHPGQGGQHVPVLATTLFDSGMGIYLAERHAELNNVGNFEELDMFGDAEAVAAYNWTLLQRWKGPAYIAMEGKDDDWERFLRNRFDRDHYPVYLETDLYDAVRNLMALPQGLLRRIDEDDDKAIEAMSGDRP